MKLTLSAEPPLTSKFEQYSISASDGDDQPFVIRDGEQPGIVRIGFRAPVRDMLKRKRGVAWLDDDTVQHEIFFNTAELVCTVSEARVFLRGLQEAVGEP